MKAMRPLPLLLLLLLPALVGGTAPGAVRADANDAERAGVAGHPSRRPESAKPGSRQTNPADRTCARRRHDHDVAYPAVGGDGKTTVRRSMLVRYAMPAGTTAGNKEIHQAYHCPNPNGKRYASFFTTFSKRPVRPGVPAVFGMVVAPIDPAAETPEAAAKQVAIALGADGAVAATLSLNGKQVEVRITDDAWTVTRGY